jgi:hypothetical protein
MFVSSMDYEPEDCMKKQTNPDPAIRIRVRD